MKKFKYVIVTPRMNNGGCLVLHTLCKYLEDLGENVKVFYLGNPRYDDSNHFSFWVNWLIFQLKVSIKNTVVRIFNDRFKSCYIGRPKGKYRRKFIPKVDDNTIVVYHEKVYGNPLHAKNVVRWFLLYNYNYKNVDGKCYGYDKDDLFFTYREVFNDFAINPVMRVLYTPYFDLDLYKRTNYGERKGKCYILRKGANRPEVPKEFDGIIIDDLPEKEKVNVFNKCEYCISYDTQTAYSQIAAMCGCISIVVPEKGKKREDYRNVNVGGVDKGYGEAFGFDESEINYSKETGHLVSEIYKNSNLQSKQNVKNFIAECSDYFLKNCRNN